MNKEILGSRQKIWALRDLAADLSKKDNAASEQLKDAADHFEAIRREHTTTRTGLAIAVRVLQLAENNDPKARELAVQALRIICTRVPGYDNLAGEEKAPGNKVKTEEFLLSIFED